MKKFIYVFLAFVLAFSLAGFAAPAPSVLVSEAVAAPADSTVTTTADTFNFSQTVLDESVVIMKWTEQNTTEGELTGLLTSILIKEGVATLVEDDITLEWSTSPGGGWSTIVADYYTAVPLTYDAEWVMGPEGGFTLPASMAEPAVFWIRATINRDLVAPVTGEVIIFNDSVVDNDRYDAGEEVAGIETTLEVMYTAELLTTSALFFAGTSTTPIQSAVNVAKPGDTVIVHPGSYSGCVEIDKSLTLESASGDWSDTAITHGCSQVIEIVGVGKPPFTGHVTISGFELCWGDEGVYIDGLAHGATVTVTNCFIHNNDDGIYGSGSLDGGIFVDNCIITDNGGKSDGIYLEDVKGTVVVSNSVIGAYYDDEVGPYLGNSYDGIDIYHIYYMANVTIGPNNIIGGNYDEGIEVDYVDGSLNITGNIIGAWDFNMDPDGWVPGNDGDGIDIMSTRPGSSVVIQDNKISENGVGGSDGIDMDTIDGSVSILGNIIGAWAYYEGESSAFFGGNEDNGIEIDDVDGTVVIDGNYIAENGFGDSDGINIDRIERDYEYNPSLGHSVYLVGSVTISNNYVGEWTDAQEETFYGNDDEGIDVGNDGDIEAGCTLAIGPNNTIVDNGHMGIYVYDADAEADVRIFDNTILRNGTAWIGIELEDSDDVIVDGNEVSGHDYGIYVCGSGSDCNAIINNVITENDVGVYIDERSNGNGIVGNWICDNEVGIWVLGDYTDILRNHIEGNTGAIEREKCGIVNEETEGNVVYYNNFVDNSDLDAGSYGVYSYKHPDETLDARWNWWGDATGPFHGGTNPSGLGDAVSSYVDYSDWATSAYDYTIDASMPWDTAGPAVTSAVVSPDVRSLYSALEDMWFSSWTADSPFSTGPSEGRYYVATSDVGAGAPPRGVKYVDIDIRAFLEQLLGGTSLENIEGIPSWYIRLVERHGQLRLCEDDLDCDGTIWTTDGPLPFTVSMLIWFMGEDLFFSMVRPGEILVPLTVTDWCGNPTETFIETAVVDEALALRRGWNLRSTPIVLAKNSWADISGLGDGLDYLMACRWNADLETWEQLCEDGLYRDGINVGDAIVKPLDGIAIKCDSPDSLGLVYDREGQPACPALPVYEGWNLIGLAVSPPQDPFMPVDDALISIEEIQDGVRGYIIVSSHFQYVEEVECYGFCYEDFCYDWYFGQEGWTFLRHGLEPEPPIPDMTIGGGYWVFMERDDILAGFSTTPFLSLTIEQGQDIPCIPRYPATTMTHYRDWLTVMECPWWQCFVADGWEGLQWAKVDYKGEFNLGDVFSYYEQQMPACDWQFGYKMVFDAMGNNREGRMAFWREAEFSGVPYYTDIAHFTINTHQGPDFIELIYLPVDVPTCPGTNLVVVQSFPDIYYGDMHLQFEGSIPSVEQLVPTYLDFDYSLIIDYDTYVVEGGMEKAIGFYMEAMSKLGWELGHGHAWGGGDDVPDHHCSLHFYKPSVVPGPWLECEIDIDWCPEFDIVFIDVTRGTFHP